MNRFQYKILVTLLILLLAVACGTIGYLVYGDALEVDTVRSPPETSEEVVAAVRELIVLPESEDPTVATVTSLTELAGQPFFKNAALGYKVLIYTKAQKAILYDPVQHKLVEVAPLAIDPTQPAP